MPEWLREFWPMVALAAPLTLGAVGWAIRMGLATRQDLTKGLDAADERVSGELQGIRESQRELSDRVLKIETDIRHLPSAEDINEIKHSIAKLGGTADATGRELTTLSRAVTRIEDFLLKAPKS